jgi:hypothetical protein
MASGGYMKKKNKIPEGWHAELQGSFPYPDSEWRAGSTYDCTRALTPEPKRQDNPFSLYGIDPFPPVKLKVHVSGTYRGFHLKITHWYAQLEFGRKHLYVLNGWKGKATSLRGALIAAMRVKGIKEKVSEIIKTAYKPGNHDCIYKMVGNKFEPWATDFNIQWYRQFLNYGEYLILDAQGRQSIYKGSGGCSVESGTIGRAETRWGDDPRLEALSWLAAQAQELDMGY